jgi:hypothetical protein
MERIKKKGNREIWLENYTEEQNISLPFKNRPFVCMIWNNKKKFISSPLIKQLVNSKCKYFVTGGLNCEKWHDLADKLILKLIYNNVYPNPDVPDNEFVMTTWHKKQPLEKIIFHGLNCTDFGNHKFRDYLIIQIKAGFSKQDILKTIDDNNLME